MNINLSAMERINQQLLKNDLLNPFGRIICVSSMSGIAGNFGQTCKNHWLKNISRLMP